MGRPKVREARENWRSRERIRRSGSRLERRQAGVKALRHKIEPLVAQASDADAAAQARSFACDEAAERLTAIVLDLAGIERAPDATPREYAA